MKKLIKHIISYFKKYKKGNIFLSFFLALILIFFSQHFYSDSEYWSKKGNIPDTFFIYLSYEGNKDDVQLEPIQPYIPIISYYSQKNNKHKKRITLSLFNEFKTYKFNIIVKNHNRIKIQQSKSTFYNKNVEFKSFKINNIEMLKNESINSVISSPLISDRIIYAVETKCKYISNYDEPGVKNYVIFSILFAVYVFIFLYLISKLKNFNLKNFTNFVYRHRFELLVFIISFFVYFVYNFYASQHVNHLTRIVQQGFIDKTYMQGDAIWVIQAIHTGQAKQFHPYFFLPLYPLYEFLMFVTRNLYLSLSLIWYTLASLSVVFLYKILNLIIPKLKIIKYLLVFIFMFSLTQLLMSYIFDLYIIAGFYLSIFAYLVLKQIKTGNYNNLILTAIVSSLIFGVNMISIVTCLILIFSLFVISNKKIKTANYFRTITGFFIMLFILVAFFIAFNSLMNNNASYKSLTTNKERIGRHIVKNPKLNLNYFHKETLLNPFVYSSSWNPAYLFYAVFILAMFYNFYLFKNNRVKKEDVVLYFSVLGAILYNYVCNFLWCPDMGFLFSQNFFILIFVLFSLSLKNMTVYLKTKNIHLCEKLNVIIAFLLVVFLMFEIILNTKTVNKQHYNAIKYNPVNKNIKINELN